MSMHSTATATATPKTKIRALREAQGYSRERIAVRAGISISTMRWAERGPQLVSMATVEKIAAALGVPASELLQ